MSYTEKAVNEQLRSFLCPEETTDNDRSHKGHYTFAQGTGFRRSAEAIIIDAIDRGSKELKEKNASKSSDVQKHKRKRRRGPRSRSL